MRKSLWPILLVTSVGLLAAFSCGGEEPSARSPVSTGGRIAYISDRECGGGLYAVNDDGSDEQRLAENGINGAPSWSPDGRQISFIGDGGLYIVDATGEHPKLLVPHPSSGTMSDAFWSPDGAHIAFQMSQDSEPESTYSVAVDGSDERKLAGGHFVGWSLDGKSAFVRYALSVATDKGVVASDQGQLRLVPISGAGEPRVLLDKLTSYSGFTLSRDGRLVAYVAQIGSMSGGPPDIALIVAKIDGEGDSKQILRGQAGDFKDVMFSPDGSQLAYLRYNYNRDRPGWAIYVVKIDGSGERSVTDPSELTGGNIAWSPDGAQIAFWGQRLTVVRLDGSSSVQPVSPPGENVRCGGSRPAWQPQASPE